MKKDSKMAKKRFTLNSFMNFDYGILDNGESIGSLANICDLLNELHKENQLLKLQVETKLFSRRKLEKENEQLKEFIDELYKKYEDAHGLSIDNTDWF